MLRLVRENEQVGNVVRKFLTVADRSHEREPTGRGVHKFVG